VAEFSARRDAPTVVDKARVFTIPGERGSREMLSFASTLTLELLSIE